MINGPIRLARPWLALWLVAAAVVLGGCLRKADAGRTPAAAAEAALRTSRPAALGSSTSGGGAGGGGAAPLAAIPDGGPRMMEIEDLRREMRAARGHALFVHLWASWCGPCLGELPVVDRFARAARARGAVVLSVSLDNDPRGVARVPSVLRARAPSLTALAARFDDPQPFIDMFSPSWEGAIPALFAFDAAGRLRSSLIGEVEPAQIDALLAQIDPSPAAAAPPRPRAPSGAGPKR